VQANPAFTDAPRSRIIENIPISVSNLHKGYIMAFLKLTEQNVQGKTVLIRADMNVPFKDGKISDDTRIRASLASIKYCLDNGAFAIV